MNAMTGIQATSSNRRSRKAAPPASSSARGLRACLLQLQEEALSIDEVMAAMLIAAAAEALSESLSA